MFKLRFWWILIKALFSRPTVDLKSHLRFWVTPFDCDINLHLNNGSFLKFMDLGRWDVLLRMRLVRVLFKAKLQPVVVNINIDFKKALAPGTFFTLDTEFLELGEKKFKFKQTFRAGHRVAAEAIVTAVFVQNGRAASTDKFVECLPEALRAEYAKHIPHARTDH